MNNLDLKSKFCYSRFVNWNFLSFRSGDQGDSSAKDGDVTATTQGERSERCAVAALGSELQEMGVTDSGFSSPRDKEDQVPKVS